MAALVLIALLMLDLRPRQDAAGSRPGAPTSAPATSRPAAEAPPTVNWPMFRGDALNRGISAARLPERLAVRWRADLGAPILSSAVIADGRVFVGTDDAWLVGLSAEDGKVLWRYKAQGPFAAAPAAGSGSVFVGDDAGVFHCVSADAGQPRWTFKTQDRIVSAAVFSGQNVVFGSYDGYVYCLAAADGGLRWKYETPDRVHGTPAVVEGHVLVAGCDAMLHVIRATDGAAVRQIPLAGASGSAAAVNGDIAFLGTQSGQVQAVDWRAGETLWTFEDPERQQPFLTSAAIGRETVLVSGRDKRVRAINQTTGRPVWTVTMRGRVEGSPVVSGGRVFIGASDGALLELAGDTGDEKWRIELGAGISASAAVATDLLVIGTEGGVVYGLGSPPKRR
ncbi:MAG: PQQ-binding-like beta-propeller repeat protein [Phycisphaerae bacterium]|nr:PQQ-binding-like beta-propeller repeat protein [Phycisphaerae bacterium]MCZ2400642.1 PQQ-binding-like beta-propeller repeat protein [Phycisphaerae bacterium]